MDFKDWDPMYIHQVIKDKPRTAIDANYWNALWNLVITQGDNNTEGIRTLLEGLDSELAKVKDKTYVHTQTTASDKWVVKHSLGKFPSVTVVDSAGTEVVGSVQHIDTNTTEIVFTASFSGKAYFN